MNRSRCLLVLAALAAVARAEEPLPSPSWPERVVERLGMTWEQGRPEVYLPLYTYHMRFAYSRQKIDRFDETPHGIGVGKGYYDTGGDWHGLYAMGFHDSHFKPEYIAGYGNKTFWRPTDDVRLGLGYTVFLTTRSDIGHYFPVPGVLPVASVEYRRLSLESAYLPGGKGYGNVLFFWTKLGF